MDWPWIRPTTSRDDHVSCESIDSCVSLGVIPWFPMVTSYGELVCCSKETRDIKVTYEYFSGKVFWVSRGEHRLCHPSTPLGHVQ